MEATARVIALNVKSTHANDSTHAKERPGASLKVSGTSLPEFKPLEGVLILLPDEHLAALGAIFCSSPLRKAMTFEAYLVAKGFARGGDEVTTRGRGI